MVTVDSLRSCVRRLHDVYRKLAPETAIPHLEEYDPFLYLERHAYRTAIHNAIEGMERARVALATAIQRMEDEAAKSQTAVA